MTYYSAKCHRCKAVTDWSDDVSGLPTCSKCYDKGYSGNHTAEFTAKRNRLIMQRRLEGWSREKIASEAGVSLRTYERIVSKERRNANVRVNG